MDSSSDFELRSELGKRVGTALVELSISQAELARRLGISQSFVSAVTRGASLPSLALVIGLRRQGVSLDWLLLGEGATMVNSAVQPQAVRSDGLHAVLDEVTAGADPITLARIEGLLLGLGVRPFSRASARSA